MDLPPRLRPEDGMTDCPPCTAPMLAAILAAVSGVAVLVGGLAAYNRNKVPR